MKEVRQLRPDKLFTKRKHYNYKKIYYGASESIKDKKQLRKEIDNSERKIQKRTKFCSADCAEDYKEAKKERRLNHVPRNFSNNN